MYNLRQLDLAEITENEQTAIIGGSRIGWGLLGAAIYDCIANHEAFVEGFNEGYEDAT